MSPEDPTASDGSATTGGVADEPGCGCRSPAVPPAGFSGFLLCLLGLRARRSKRTRRAPSAALGGLLLVALAAGPAACNGGPATTELPMTTTTSGETETDTDTEKLPSEPDPRFFGTFHTELVHPGWSNEHFPDGDIVISGYRLLTLTPDGSARVEGYGCWFPFTGDFLEFDELYTWTYISEAREIVIESLGDREPSESTSRIESMVVGLHSGCDESLMVTTHYASRTSDTYAFRPGRLCAEFSDVENCRYSLHWCDEGEPGALCPEARPI